MIDEETGTLKCSECYQRWCIYRNALRDKCWYVDEHFAEELANKVKILIAEQMEEENKNKVKPFYMVYVMGQNGPRKTYDDAQEAAKEAKQLCAVERKSAYVLKAVAGYEFFSRIDEIQVEG